MTNVKKGDFVEVEYTGRLKDEDLIFDTTSKEKAKETGLYDEKMEYGPVIVVLGEKQLVEGLDKKLEGKEAGKEYIIELSPEEGFGKKDAKLIRMIPFRTFKKQGIMPEPGMQVNVDNLIGIIKTASGGRCMVDFNHPLSGKNLIYKVKINKLVTDDAEKIKSYTKITLNLSSEVKFEEGKAEIKTKKEIPEQIQETLGEHLKNLISTIKEITFVVEKTEDVKKPNIQKSETSSTPVQGKKKSDSE